MDKPEIDIEKLWELRQIYRRVANASEATSNKKPSPSVLLLPAPRKVENPLHRSKPWADVDEEFPLPGGDMLVTNR